MTPVLVCFACDGQLRGRFKSKEIAQRCAKLLGWRIVDGLEFCPRCAHELPLPPLVKP